MSLGSVPAVPLPPLGLARVLSERAGARCCVCLRCRLRSFSSRTVRKMMMSRKMTQPAPTAANNATLELKKLSESPLLPPLPPGPLFSSWFTVSEDGKWRGGTVRDTWQTSGWVPSCLSSETRPEKAVAMASALWISESGRHPYITMLAVRVTQGAPTTRGLCGHLDSVVSLLAGWASSQLFRRHSIGVCRWREDR